MTMSENANLVEGLRRLGFSDTQIIDFLLAVGGRISLDELERRYKEAEKTK